MKTTLRIPGDENWLMKVNSNAEFRLASRWTEVTFVISIDEVSYAYRISSSSISPADLPAEEDPILLQGSKRAWHRFLLDPPPPHHNHVLAMDRRSADFSIVSGRHRLIQNLRTLTIALDLMRGCDLLM